MGTAPHQHPLPTVLVREKGATPSERKLKQLCDRSFLSYWSYANIFRDQDISKGEGKEICDVLVTFGDHVLIFSDKDCAFPTTGNLPADWGKWYRRAIEAGAKQIFGAERWLKKFPNRIFLDRKCQNPLPIDLPPADRAKYHRIIVAHGSGAACAEFYGGSGSLILDSSLVGCPNPEQNNLPFSVGHIDNTRRFVHILDDVTFDLLLRSGDTITDFVDYLGAKEQLFTGKTQLIVTGEEDLLGFYLKRTNAAGKHSFNLPEGLDLISISEGEWTEFVQSAAYRSQQYADRVSYTWDRLIELFAKHISAGTTYFSKWSIKESEMGLRVLASEPRVARRFLAKALMDFLDQSRGRFGSSRTVMSEQKSGRVYIFVAMAQPKSASDEEYREVRAHLLQSYMKVVKLRVPKATEIIGIATEPGMDGVRSEDLAYFDASHWTLEDEQEARAIQSDLGLLTKTTMTPFHIREYPNESARPLVVNDGRRNRRNLACPCGSGLKFKKCCGGRRQPQNAHA